MANKQLAFKIGKEKFFKHDSIQHLMSAGRFLHARDDISLFSTFGLKRENIQVFFDSMKENLNTGNLIGVSLILNEFEKQLSLFSELDLVYRIAARIFFKEKDDLAFDLEPSELDRRVELFKKKELVSLLSQEPLTTLLSLTELLKLDSKNYLIQRDQVIRKSSLEWLMTMAT